MRSSTSTTDTMGSSVSTNPIARDIQNVVTDAQELLKTVQDASAKVAG